MSVLTFEPGNVWLISQRCWKSKPLLADSVDRRRWVYWLFQAKRRYGLCVLNYMVLPDEVTLLLMDRRRCEIRSGLPYIADAMTRDYQSRHRWKTPLWEKQCCVTPMKSGIHRLGLWLSDMDISIVRAHHVDHPNLWPECGYHELQHPPSRASRLDFSVLQRLLTPISFARLQHQRCQWVTQALSIHASDAPYRPGTVQPRSAETTHRSGAHTSTDLRSSSLSFDALYSGLRTNDGLPERALVPKPLM